MEPTLKQKKDFKDSLSSLNVHELGKVYLLFDFKSYLSVWYFFHFTFSVSFARAYIHQYTKFGIEEEDFLDSFTLLEQVVASYRNLWSWTKGSRGKMPYVIFGLKYFQYYFHCMFSNSDLWKPAKSNAYFFCILCPQNRRTF